MRSLFSILLVIASALAALSQPLTRQERQYKCPANASPLNTAEASRGRG